MLILYAQLRLQGHLPLNPDHFAGTPPALSFNTAASFLTNTNWQNYSGESTMSYLTQMAGLAVHNFVSAAAGAAVAVALVRASCAGARTRSATSGSTSRARPPALLPIAFVGALVLVSQGAVQNFHATKTVKTVEGQSQSIPGGAIASQEAIKDAGQNGGGPYNANSSHPFENPNPITNILTIWLILALPFAFPWMFGKMAGSLRQGMVVLAVMFAFWFAARGSRCTSRPAGNPKLTAVGVSQTATATQPGGNFEGKETRFGSAGCGLFADSTTGTSTGAINCAHDSMTPIGGAVPLVNIMLGEVTPGGTGSGLYGMLIFALTSVFIAGLMVGRTPEYLGKKIQAAEMKLVVVYLLAVPLVILTFAGISIVLKTALHSQRNTGPHGLTEMVYAFASSANNNGSGVRRAHGQHAVVQHDTRALHARRPLLPDGPCARDRRFARTQAAGAAVGRHVPHRHSPLRGAARRRRDHRRRSHLLPGDRARAHRRAPRRKVLKEQQ